MKNVYVFDIDGVLCVFRYCENKISLDAKKWIMACMRGEDTYKTAKPVNKFVKFINDMIKADPGNAKDFYVCSAACGNKEGDTKMRWLERNYPNIKHENIFIVSNASYKLPVLQAIHEETGKPVVLIDDMAATVVGVDIDENDDLISLHISEFLDDDIMTSLQRLSLE